MNELVFTLLGPIEVRWSGVPLAGFRSSKARALLAYLVAEPDRSHPRESLATILWGEYDEQAARTSLRMTLSNLRKVLNPVEESFGRKLLLVDRKSASWRSSPSIAVDLHELDRCWAKSARHGHQDLQDCHECLALFEQAIHLYQGGFLDGLDLANAPGFDEWRTVQQERVHRRIQSMLHTLALHDLTAGRPDRAESFARRQVEMMPWNEDGHRLLMRALADQGRRSDALAQFQRCRRALAQEMGVEPSVETVALFSAIENQSYRSQSPAPAAGQPTVVAPRHNLPTQLTPFFGRTVELSRIVEELSVSPDRVLSLVGPGGVGKTRLGLVAAERLVARFADGVWFVSLAGIDPAIFPNGDGLTERVATTVGAALGIQFHGTEKPARHLQHQLRNRQLLLLLDGVDHLLEGHGEMMLQEWIHDLLAGATGIKLLVTSRRRLMLQAESVLLLDGLGVPPDDTPSGALQADSVRMFTERARRVVAGFNPDDELACIVQLCRFVQGLPLAIELAASWALHYSCREIVGQMGGLDIFSTDRQDLPDHHRSMRAVFEQSWRILSETEQKVLIQVSIFRGSFSRQAALSITDGSIRELASLVDKSLLRRLAGGRYQLHELLRQFLAEKRADAFSSEQWQGLREKYRRYYLSLLAENESLLHSGAAAQTVAGLHQDLDNLRRAWQFGLEQEDIPGLAGSLRALCLFYTLDGLFREGEALLGRTVSVLQATFKDNSSQVDNLLARVQVEKAQFQNRQGRLDAALRTAEDAIQQADAADAVEARILARTHQGFAFWRQGNIEAAEQVLAQALALALDSGRQDLESYVRSRMGALDSMRGNLDASRQAFENYLHFCRDVGDIFEEAIIRNNLGYIYHALGEYSTAQDYFEQSLAIKQDLGVRQGMGNTLINLGVIALTVGRYPQALQRYEQALAFSQDLGDNRLQGLALSNLSLLHFEQKHFNESVAAARQGIRLLEQVGDRPILAYLHTHLGNGLAGLEQFQNAEIAYSEALRLYDEVNQPNPKAETLAGQAALYLQMNQPEQALLCIGPLLVQLLQGVPVGTLRPFRIYLVSYQALAAKADPRAEEVLATGQRFLQEAAEKISDLEQRRSFLQNVFYHRELLQHPPSKQAQRPSAGK